MPPTDRYLAFMGLAPKRIPHWEHWSCPDAETYLTGIDYYEHPRLCRQRMLELYPFLSMSVPKEDKTVPRPELDLAGTSSAEGDKGHVVRWGANTTATWEHGEKFFKTPEEVFAFSPLAHAADLQKMNVVELHDYSSEAALYAKFSRGYAPEDGERGPEGSHRAVSFYNTMFMWPLLTFGWELFLECCLDERFDRVMDEFAEINRRVFRAFTRLPVNFVICHDDITNTRGPVCSPAWMKKNIFPRYEEYWSLLKAAGKEVLFMVDGRIDRYADDIFACGARGIISEPYTDYKTIARNHKDCFLAGEGDNRVLYRNNPDEIKAMVQGMVETAKLTGGYMMCIGNHIPWNVPPPAIKRYFELSLELAHR